MRKANRFIKHNDKWSINITILVVLFSIMYSSSFAGMDDAYEHIYEAMDRYHRTFDVYTDLSAAGNHFVTLGRTANPGGGDNVAINPGSTISPHSGDTCIKNKFIASGNNWGGWYFMNGVLEGEETQPKPNWGDYANAGIDLTGATQLTFWARGEKGGERVEFFAFGVGRDPETGDPNKPYPDSSPKVSSGYLTLCNNWTQYTVDLNDCDLSYVLGGFGWVTNAPDNNNQDITFYIDDIRYNKSRLSDPRFLVSYETVPSSLDFDSIMKNAAFTYDNALVLIALLARGTAEDMERARLVADALVYAINNDRYFMDGRLRNAYQGGDLILFPGWRPNNRENTVRMPGWWDPNDNNWYEDKVHVSTHTGSVAWSIIALLSYYQQVGGSQYLDAARVLGEWIEAETRDPNGPGGYTGGYEGWEATGNNPQGQTKLPWKSTEHNIDAYVAFMRLYEVIEDPNWMNRALHAKTFVEAMWDETEGHFWTGTKDDGITINKDNIPVDIQAWVVMAMDSYHSALSWAENDCYIEADGFKGFDFNNDRDGVWFEGTAQMAVAYQINGEPNKSGLYLSELLKAQELATNTNGKGIVAASHDGITTGFDWEYFSRLHIGATAWYIFAEKEYNPYWGTKATTPQIEFTYAPPFGSYDDLEGWVLCTVPNDCNNYAVAVYIWVPPYGWWTKPSWAQPLTPIAPDCTWTCDITTGGQDECATKILAFLVPKGYVPPKGSGQQCLPCELYQFPYALVIRYEKINFAGYDWWVKRHCDPVGPGPNYFSDSNDNVWVDPNGHLHLRIEQRDERWYCSEVIATTNLGYGTYIFTVQGRVDLLDENIVLGLFNWDDSWDCNVPQYNYREIDIEISRWGDPCEPNYGQYVVQPWNTPGNMHRFNIGEHKTAAHVFSWKQDRVYFRSYYGDFSLMPPTENMIAFWHYTGSDVPPAGAENPRINLWLVNGNAPTNGQDAEIVIKSFRYLPDIRPEIDFVDFALFALHWLEVDCGSCDGADLTGDANVDIYDLRKLTENWLEVCWE